MNSFIKHAVTRVYLKTIPLLNYLPLISVRSLPFLALYLFTPISVVDYTVLRLISFIVNHNLCLIPLSLHFRRTQFRNIAFIMDGNRRYAAKKAIADGESKRRGFSKMLEVAHFCKRLGVKEVSFFALSKANLGRPRAELEGIVALIKDERSLLKNQGMRIVVYGEPGEVSHEVGAILAEVEEKTLGCEFLVNIFFNYSSKEEIETKILYEKNVDVLVRTSGEKRLSDFLLYQVCRGSIIVFCKVYWPELSLNLLSAILMKCEKERKLYK